MWARPQGTGIITVNGVDYTKYFDTKSTHGIVTATFRVLTRPTNCDFHVLVNGGGKVGQAHAVKLAISRVLLKSDSGLRPLLRSHGLLTVDARVKERKKYGQRGARRKFQFVKR